MSDDRDDIEGEGAGRKGPPAVSRLTRPGERRFRTTTRYRGRDRFVRSGKQLPIGDLIGQVIRRYGLTDEVRQHFVCLHWFEIAGERFAARTFPTSFAKGVMEVSVVSSSWVQEMRFFKDQLITSIHQWIDANRIWLGPPPLVSDIRFVLGTPRRAALVDREHVRRLRAYHARRIAPRPRVVPPIASDIDRAAICAETSAVPDPEVRAAIETVRLKWNR